MQQKALTPKIASSQWQIFRTKSIWPRLTNGVTVLDQITEQSETLSHRKDCITVGLVLGVKVTSHYTTLDVWRPQVRPYQLKHLLSKYKTLSSCEF